MKMITIALLLIPVCVVAEMVEYNTDNIKTGISSWEYVVDNDVFAIKFKAYPNKTFYYPANIYGKDNLDMMTKLAKEGKGLNSFINKMKIQRTPSPTYCGEAGGYDRYQFKYEISDRGKARAALSYRNWAPNPEGIQACVCKHYKDFPSCKKLKKETK